MRHNRISMNIRLTVCCLVLAVLVGCADTGLEPILPIKQNTTTPSPTLSSPTSTLTPSATPSPTLTPTPTPTPLPDEVLRVAQQAYQNGDWEVAELLCARSPVLNVANAATPTLILHGEHDPRVPLSQGREFYNALKRRGCTVQMVVYPRTGHVPHEPKLLQDVMTRTLAWMDRYLMKAKR